MDQYNIEYLTNLFARRKKIIVNNQPVSEFINEVIACYENSKSLRQKIDQLTFERRQAERNRNIQLAAEIKSTLNDMYIKYDELSKYTHELQKLIPASLNDSVPEENTIVEQYGDLNPKIKQHEYNGIYTDTIFGSKLIVKSSEICRIERALISWCMNELAQHEFEEYSIPSLIRQEIMYDVGHLPHSRQDMFFVAKGANPATMCLSPTGEVGLMAWATHFKGQELKICTVNQCYRAESGASGSNNKGLYRLHEFTKCEMVVITTAEKSYEMLQTIKNISVSLIKQLGLPLQVELLGGYDVGNHSCMTYDIKSCVNNQWTEVASISNCEDYQTRGLNLRINGKFAHSLNGTAIALSRIMAAIIEHYYDENTQSIIVPNVLKKFIPEESGIRTHGGFNSTTA